MKDVKSLRFETRLIHAGDAHPRIGGAAVMPIFQSTVFEQAEGPCGYDDIVYPRLSTLPNQIALGEKLASLEGGEAGFVTASGMAAISTALLSVLRSSGQGEQGGHVLAVGAVYGGTHSLITHDLPRLGITHDFVDLDDPPSWAKKLRKGTRAIYAESMNNPLLHVADHRALIAFAREHGLVSIIDNTFATPVNFRPIEIGYDLVVHSATKYLNGHSDLAAGAVVGSRERVMAARHLLNHLGGSLDAHACFLLDRGLKTLALRVRHQSASALRLARCLAGHREVRRIGYPGLDSHPHHDRASALFTGFGGMLSFELESAEAASAWIRRLAIPIQSASLGGPETLVTRPAISSHSGMTPAERASLGIGDGLIRLSVGLEAVEDLEADLLQAFSS